MTKAFPQIKTVALNINRSKSSDIYGEETEILWGQEAIHEEVLDYGFALSPRAFYQLNPEQTEVLYGEVVKALDVGVTDHIIDAYCGVGSIGFAFAGKVKSVRGWISSQKLLRMHRKTPRSWALTILTMRQGRQRILFLNAINKVTERMLSLSIRQELV